MQLVGQDVADNWFVKAHCQELTQEDVENGELQLQVEQLQGDLKLLQEQSDKATETINKLIEEAKVKDKEISDLKILLAKAEQTPAAATDVNPKVAPKAKEQPKEA